MCIVGWLKCSSACHGLGVSQSKVVLSTGWALHNVEIEKKTSNGQDSGNGRTLHYFYHTFLTVKYLSSG